MSFFYWIYSNLTQLLLEYGKKSLTFCND